MEDNLYDREDDKSPEQDLHKSSGEGDDADTASSEGETASKKSDDHDEMALTVPEVTERQVSITLTTSGAPSNTFMTDLKTTDINMVR